MNSRQLQYAVTLAKTLNFSQAAQEFNISQPAFSKQIIGLENELGIKLFDRGSSQITLTPAGEYFVKKAENLLFEEEQLTKSINDFKTGEMGRLVIGVPPFRAQYMMADIVASLKEKFPGLQVVLAEYALSILKKGLLDGEYDFAIMNLPVDETEFDVIPLERDNLVLALPESLALYIDANEQTGKIDMSDCEKLPFAVVSPGQEMRKLFDNLCALSNVKPPIYVEVVGVTTAWEMVKKGLAAALVPKQFVKYEAALYNVKLFEFKQNAYVRQPAIVTRRGQFVSKYAKFAIEELKNKL